MTKEQEELFRNWNALKDACRATHKKGAGAATQCVCGAGGGGSTACNMLGTIRSLIMYLPVDKLPAEWKVFLEDLNKII